MQTQQMPLVRDIFPSHCLDYNHPNNVSVFMCCVMLPILLLITGVDFSHFTSSLLNQCLKSRPFVSGATMGHTLLKCLPRVLKTLSFHVVLWKSCPLWFFTFRLLRPRCGPRPCVYAARGDAWRQTSTPHPNNGPLLCLPLFCRLIIRIVSGEWGCNTSYKLLWGPSLNSLVFALPSLSLLSLPRSAECVLFKGIM